MHGTKIARGDKKQKNIFDEKSQVLNCSAKYALVVQKMNL